MMSKARGTEPQVNNVRQGKIEKKKRKREKIKAMSCHYIYIYILRRQLAYFDSLWLRHCARDNNA
jgi:hypothetical protein